MFTLSRSLVSTLSLSQLDSIARSLLLDFESLSSLSLSLAGF